MTDPSGRRMSPLELLNERKSAEAHRKIAAARTLRMIGAHEEADRKIAEVDEFLRSDLVFNADDPEFPRKG